MESKNNKTIVALLLLFIVVSFSLLGYIIYDKVLLKEDGETNNNKSNENILEYVSVTDFEVRELYNDVKASLNSNNVCLGYYYQNPFKNHTVEDKISLILFNYAASRQKEIDDNFLQKINESDREFIKTNSTHYIKASVVAEAMQYIFNIKLESIDENIDYGTWKYRSDAEAFVSFSGGGAYDAKVYQQVIEYNELEDEINLTVAKAELGFDGNVYRYVNDKNTLVIVDGANNFQFTKENVDKFPQIKYIFKKNNEGNYYIYDIVNLNFEEDYEICE